MPAAQPFGRLRRCLALLLAMLVWLAAGSARADEPVWRDLDEHGESRVHLYFFWSESCPHCREARPAVERIAARRAWLVVHDYDVSADPAARELYMQIAELLGEEARYVPAFAFCETLTQGFAGEAQLEARLQACHEQRAAGASTTVGSGAVTLPLFGEIDVRTWSLPATTIVLAGLDAFNPCAFFVLLFLLSLLVRAHARPRMVLISSVFIAVSGVWYFVFMAAWLNVFLWFGELRWMTLAAGVVAVIMSALNIKDFFAPARGPSLSIPASKKPSLFARMRRLARATSLPSALLATVVLAAAANTYELLCTAGLPMIYII